MNKPYRVVPERDLHHIQVDGHPGCQRPADGEALLFCAAALGVHLGCTFDQKWKAERAAALMMDFHPEWKVTVHPGHCDVMELMP